MRLTGGVGGALGFNLLLVAGVGTLGWLLGLSLQMNNAYFSWAEVAFTAIYTLIGAAIWALVYPFLHAALLHISLRMLGAGTYRYANTAKVVLYLNGWTWTLFALGSFLSSWLLPPFASFSGLGQIGSLFLLFGGYYTFALSSALDTTLLKGFSACVISVSIGFGAMVAVIAGFFTVCLMAF